MIRALGRRLRARRAGADRDAGLTIVELAVAMLVGSLLLAAVATVFTGVLRSTRTINSKAVSGADVRLATEAMTRTLKVANTPYGEAASFTTATSTSMTFYALLNRTGATSSLEPVPTMVSYTWDATAKCVYEYQTPGSVISTPTIGGPYFSWPTSARSRKCLLRTTTAPAFTYFDTGLITATAMTPATGLSADDLGKVRSVLINLTATDPANPSVAGVPTETRISLENLINADGT